MSNYFSSPGFSKPEYIRNKRDMTTQQVCTYNGKRYPRPEDGKMMYLSEAMARLGGTKFVVCGSGPYPDIVIFGNNFGDHAPEGMEILGRLSTHRIEMSIAGEQVIKFRLFKREVSARCVVLRLMTQAENEQPQVFPADEV